MQNITQVVREAQKWCQKFVYAFKKILCRWAEIHENYIGSKALYKYVCSKVHVIWTND